MTDEKFYQIVGTVARIIGVVFLVAIGVILTDIKTILNAEPLPKYWVVCLPTEDGPVAGMLCKQMNDVEVKAYTTGVAQ